MFRLRPVRLPADYPSLATLLACLQPEVVSVDQFVALDGLLDTAEPLGRDAAGRLTGSARQR